MFSEDHRDNLFPTVTPTVIENVEIILPPEIERFAEVFKSDALKDIQHEIQSPGKPNRNKVGRKIAEMMPKTRQDLKKKGVLQVTGRKLYLVGGVVRDWLINHFHGIAYPPDDYDLATDAGVDSLKLIVKAGMDSRLLPDDTALHVNSGKFNNVQITISGKTFGITTFPFAGYADAPRMYLDSLRRNFNVNALYYSIDENKIFDFHAGIADIHRKSPQFVGRVKNKLKDEGGNIYPLIYARLHSRMNSKIEIDKQTKNELGKFILPYDADRSEIRAELHKGVKQALDKSKYFKLLNELGILKQLFPSLKINPDAPMGDMTMFPQLIAQLLQPNWNNLGLVYEVLNALEFQKNEIRDIVFLMKLPHYNEECTLKNDRLHTGLSERAIEQFLKTNNFKNGEWVMAVLKGTNLPLKQQAAPVPQKEDVPPILQVAHHIVENKKYH